MKAILKHALIIYLACMTLLFTSSCEKEPLVPDGLPPITETKVHIDEFAEAIENGYANGFVGFQYTIAQNGLHKHSNALGKASLSVNGEDYDYENYHRKSLQSCSKTISAAALIFELKKNNVDPGEAIDKYLPERWNTEHVKNITFHELLRHRSGLRGTHDLYEQMKVYLEAGDFESKSYKYANINFSLMRILIPNINEESRTNLNHLYGTHGEDTYAWQVAQSYLFDCRENILKPSGINAAVAPTPWDSLEVLDNVKHYNYSDQSLAGYEFTDQILKTGAGGWYMNAQEYAAFLSHLTEDAFDIPIASDLMDNEYGMYDGTWDGVEYYTHNGAFTKGDGRGARALWVYIPSTGIIVTVQINSGSNAHSMNDLLGGILQAHNEAYY